MMKQDDKLTLQETEQLCRLYMDCNLSVLEEAELRYFLTRVDYHSPLIDEVRLLMDIDSCISDTAVIKADSRRKHLLRGWPIYAGIAASLAIVICIGISFLLRYSSPHSSDSQSYYIAYVDGQRLSDDVAKIQIEEEKKQVDDFIKEMAELEARNQQMIDNFFNP